MNKTENNLQKQKRGKYGLVFGLISNLCGLLSITLLLMAIYDSLMHNIIEGMVLWYMWIAFSIIGIICGIIAIYKKVVLLGGFGIFLNTPIYIYLIIVISSYSS